MKFAMILTTLLVSGAAFADHHEGAGHAAPPQETSMQESAGAPGEEAAPAKKKDHKKDKKAKMDKKGKKGANH